ncbi:MAG TPA: DUF4242 domain-containing protein [Pseudolabrys sp.]|jgi:hypothetical protein|uniref:DUF4242 domain-containing protein n=1 Tax=Pseudolabrys sp. TaxID=1960880 RepID=UPI002DDD5C3D|nr:DUF4242 domain-containing protein [Pseudolabrys sp.]HEV2627355.1 DUF4242 domain-containing protein [Pseudolabrys sp.]
MKRYVIERDIPNIGQFDRIQFCQAALTSNAALAQLDGQVQWVHSYVAANKTFCVYLSPSEALVHEHARLSGFPVTRITEATAVIDPTTANRP